jgi:phosphatidylcholine synthase
VSLQPAYLVHVYTATGVIWALLATLSVLDGDYRAAFLWLVLATLIDATDGWLARLADLSRTAPLIDGARLDDIIDYLTYVFVPALLVWHAGLLPPASSRFVIGAVLLASACGFARRDAKTADHFFTGFPSYWNIVAVYLVALQIPPRAAAVLLFSLAALVFVPIRYIYPSRTTTLMWLTVPFGAIWGAQLLLVIWWLPDPPRWLVISSLAFPIYYVLLSCWVTLRRGARV